MEDVKIKISVLWLFFAVATLAFTLVWFMEPGVIDQFREGVVEGIEMGSEILMVFAIVFVVPLVMSFLSLNLKNPTNRWANIILSIVFFVLVIITAHASAPAILIMLSQLAALALIVWYAWKWPKQEE